MNNKLNNLPIQCPKDGEELELRFCFTNGLEKKVFHCLLCKIDYELELKEIAWNICT